MFNVLDVRRRGDRFEFTRVDEALVADLKGSLTEIGRDPSRMGITEAEIFIALAKDRDLLDPFGILLRIMGNVMKYVGTFYGSSFFLLCILFTGGTAVKAGYDLFGALRSQLDSLFKTFSSSEDRTKDADAGPADSGFLVELIHSFIPAPISFVLNRIIAIISEPRWTLSEASPVSTTAPNPGQGFANALAALTADEGDML